MGLLDGKVALITGGGAGIGRGVARRFVQEGACVVVAEYNPQSCIQIRGELEALGGRAVVLEADVSHKDQVLGAVQTAIDAFGGIDLLINNAFALNPRTLLEYKTDEMLESMLRSGLWAAWWAMQAARPSMVARGGGSVVNFYSIQAQTGAWLDADYIVNKAALLGLTRSAANEWGRFNIRVNAIAPTAAGAAYLQWAAENPDFAAQSAASKPLGRIGDPEADIAPVVLFLASEMSRYVTGELIHVDGGLHMSGHNSRPDNIPELEAQGRAAAG